MEVRHRLARVPSLQKATALSTAWSLPSRSLILQGAGKAMWYGGCSIQVLAGMHSVRIIEGLPGRIVIQ